MNKKLLLLIGVFCFFWTATKAQTNQDEILKQCFSLEALLKKMPNDLKKANTIFILDHGVDFDFSKNLKVNRKQVTLVTKEDLKRNPNMGYFLFHTISIDKNKSLVRYYFIYTKKGTKYSFPITIDFEKNNVTWEVVNYSIK
jgi:hypothetical protein